METTLSNTLAILVAFATLMLLYSIVVTSLVQATQSVLRLRSRNLWRVISRILESERTVDSEDPSTNAFKVISSSASSVFKLINDPGPIARILLAPDVTWLDSGQLRTALTQSKLGFTDAQVGNIVTKFSQTEKASSKRFQFLTRIVTIVWAGLIAVYFQLSTPDLLAMLSSNESARQELIEHSETFTNQGLGQEQKIKAQSMFYLEPGRLSKFLVYREGTGDASKLVIIWKDAAGVVMTILLLTLGAPFWFNTLRSVVNLRDALNKDNGKGPDKAAPAGVNVDQ